MDALGNPFVLGALRCLDGSISVLEEPPEQEDMFVSQIAQAIELAKRAVALLERAHDTSAPQ